MAGDSLKCVHLVRGGEDVFRTCRKGLASTLCMGGEGGAFLLNSSPEAEEAFLLCNLLLELS